LTQAAEKIMNKGLKLSQIKLAVITLENVILANTKEKIAYTIK